MTDDPVRVIRTMERSRTRSETVRQLREDLLAFDQDAVPQVLSYSPYGEPEFSFPHPRRFDDGPVVL